METRSQSVNRQHAKFIISWFHQGEISRGQLEIQNGNVGNASLDFKSPTYRRLMKSELTHEEIK